MKTLIKIAIILLIIAGALFWFFSPKDDMYSLENAIATAEQSECAGYGTIATGEYYEDYGVWYLDIDLPDSNNPEDYEFAYTCEVDVYAGTVRLIVDKAINWFESDFE
jgi:hypothetical protein